MHLIVLTEGAQGRAHADAAALRADTQALIARWSPLMLRLAPGWTLAEEPGLLNSLAERVQAQLVLGRPLRADEDGRIPLQAWFHASDVAHAQEPCARLTPFHGLVGSDRITLVPPDEQQLSVAESKALFDTLQPLFESEGVALVWNSPLNWTVRHESLRHLPCASLDRAEGDSVQRWQGATPLNASRLLRRLQNEAQMVLHDHPVNQARAQRGALAVNSLWLDHAGAADELPSASGAPAPSVACAAVPVEVLRAADSALQAWVDAALVSPNGPDRPWSEPTLVLCGRHRAQAFTMRQLPSGWRGAIARTLMRPPRTPPLSQWLDDLDRAPAEGPA